MPHNTDAAPCDEKYSESLRRKIFDLGKMGLWSLRLTREAGLLSICDRFIERVGGPADTPRDLKLFCAGLIHPDDSAAVLNALSFDFVSSSDGDIVLECRIWNRNTESWHRISVFGCLERREGDALILHGAMQDIHERTAALEEPAQARRLDSLLLSSLPGMFFVVDDKARLCNWNQNFKNAFLSPAEDPLGKSLFDFFPPEIRKEITASFNDILLREANSIEAPLLHVDGSRHIYGCFGQRFIMNGKFHVACSLSDLTSFHSTQKALVEERSKLDAVIKAAHLGTWDWNVQTGAVTYNQIWADLAGRRLQDIQGSVSAWEETVLPEDLPPAMAAVDAHCRGETPVYEAEFRMRRKDGTVFWGLDRGRVVEWNSKGEPIRMLGILQDITPMREIRQELARSKQQLELAVRESRLGTWDWNLDTGHIVFNDLFFSMLGYSPEDIIPDMRFWLSLLHPEDMEKALAALREHIEGKTDTYECEMRIRHADGHYVWTVDIGRIVERSPSGAPLRIVGGHFDIDKRKQAEQRQQKALAERTKVLKEARHRLRLALQTEEDRDPRRANLALLQDILTDDQAIATEDNFPEAVKEAVDLISDKIWWYRSVLDAVPFPVSVAGPDNRWAYLNKPALETEGAKNVNALLGKPVDPWWLEGDSRNRENTEADRIVFQRYHPGLKRYYHGQVRALTDSSGKPAGYVEAMFDATAIHDAGERLYAVLDSLPFPCTIWDHTGTNVTCNNAAAKFFDLPDKQTYLNRFSDLSPEFQPDGRRSADIVREQIYQAFSGGCRVFEWMHQMPDGTPVPCEITLLRVLNGKEQVVVSWTRDLRTLKAKDSALNKERELLQKITAGTPLCFLMVTGGEVRYSSPCSRERFDVWEGEPIAKLFADQAEHDALFSEAAENGHADKRAISATGRDGKPRKIIMGAFTAEYQEEQGTLVWLWEAEDMAATANLPTAACTARL